MRFGVIADVHANWHALDAALAFLARENIAAYLCAGDLVGYGPLPNEAAARVLSLPGHTVAGNHELIALGAIGDARCTEFARSSLRWTRETLQPDIRERLARLPRRLLVECGVALAHGSWEDPQEYVRTPREAQGVLRRLALQHPEVHIMIVGHTHLPLAVGERTGSLPSRERRWIELPIGDRVLLNPGAVGQTRSGPPRARVMILDLEANRVAFHALRYDIRGCRRSLRDQGLPRHSCHLPEPWSERGRRLIRRALRSAASGASAA